jgi:hypothetical protein
MDYVRDLNFSYHVLIAPANGATEGQGGHH